jgi:hypothetical protein
MVHADLLLKSWHDSMSVPADAYSHFSNVLHDVGPDRNEASDLCDHTGTDTTASDIAVDHRSSDDTRDDAVTEGAESPTQPREKTSSIPSTLRAHSVTTTSGASDYERLKDKSKLIPVPHDRPLILQLCSNDVDEFVDAVLLVQRELGDYVDGANHARAMRDQDHVISLRCPCYVLTRTLRRCSFFPTIFHTMTLR